MRRYLWTAALCAAIVVGPRAAWAGSYDDCAGDATVPHVQKREVRSANRLCWNVDGNDAADTLSDLVQIREAAGKVCIVPNKAAGTGAGPDQLTMDVLFYPMGPWGVCASGVDAGNVCSLDSDCTSSTCTFPGYSVLDADLDGTVGSSANQNICTETLPRGAYRCQIGSAAGSGDLGACVFSAHGKDQ